MFSNNKLTYDDNCSNKKDNNYVILEYDSTYA